MPGGAYEHLLALDRRIHRCAQNAHLAETLDQYHDLCRCGSCTAR
jgi:hypothetical protein